MSNVALRWALKQSVGDKTAKALLLLLAEAADASGCCFHRQKELAAILECSHDSVQRAMRKLEVAGLLSRSRRVSARGYRTSDLCTLSLHAMGTSPNTQPAAKADDGLARKLRAPNTQPAGDQFLEPSLNPQSTCSIEPDVTASVISTTQPLPLEFPASAPRSTANSAPSEAKSSSTRWKTGPDLDAFERFYQAYPHRVARKRAEKAFGKLSPADRVRAITGAATFAARCQAKGTKLEYIPHPATWLNDERFNDEAEPAPPCTTQPSPSNQRAVHLGAVRLWSRTKIWDERLGPPPGDNGCKIDEAVIAEAIGSSGTIGRMH